MQVRVAVLIKDVESSPREKFIRHSESRNERKQVGARRYRGSRVSWRERERETWDGVRALKRFVRKLPARRSCQGRE